MSDATRQSGAYRSRYTIRCLTGTTPLWSETFTNEQDAAHYWGHKAKLARQYGPTATGFRFEFYHGEILVDAFDTATGGEE